MSDLGEKNSNAQKFIKGLLKDHSGLNAETIDILTDKTGLPIFLKALSPFADKSLRDAGPKAFGRDQLEFIGDSVMNDATTLFILNKYPKYTVKGLTNIKHTIISTRGTAILATHLGFLSYLHPHPRSGSEQEKIVGGGLKAFLGALRQIIDSKSSALGAPVGVGTLVTHKFIFSILNEMVWTKRQDLVSHTPEKIKDPATRINQIMIKYGFGSIQKMLTSRKFSRGWESQLILNNPSHSIIQKMTSKIYSSKKESEQEVARQAINLFQTRGLSE